MKHKLKQVIIIRWSHSLHIHTDCFSEQPSIYSFLEPCIWTPDVYIVITVAAISVKICRISFAANRIITAFISVNIAVKKSEKEDAEQKRIQYPRYHITYCKPYPFSFNAIYRPETYLYRTKCFFIFIQFVIIRLWSCTDYKKYTVHMRHNTDFFPYVQQAAYITFSLCNAAFDVTLFCWTQHGPHLVQKRYYRISKIFLTCWNHTAFEKTVSAIPFKPL